MWFCSHIQKLQRLDVSNESNYYIHTDRQGTKQACLFRDDYTPLTATGFSIFGLSRDSPKLNTTFKTKQNLPYTLLCDQAGTLVSAIGLGSKGKSTATRGVFVVDKSGKVLAAEAGGPEPTVQVVKKLVTSGGHSAEPVNASELTPVANKDSC